MGQVVSDSTGVHAHTGTPCPDAAPVRPVSVSSRIDLAPYSHLPRLLTPAQVGRESNLSKPVINAAIQSGRLRSVKPTTRARRIPVEWFAEWIERMKAESTQAAS